MYIPKDINSIISELQTEGYRAHLVGGCVRDIIMGSEPNDYDVTTSATPDEIQRVFEHRKTLTIGIKHGTITVFSDENRPVEITTYRVDGEYVDNRHPEQVSFVDDIKPDLSRRDFTINALAYNSNDGIIDYFGGIDDIHNKIIRCVGEPDLRFNEDALRIIRGLRFSSTLNFTVEKNTSDSIIYNRFLLNNVSVERLFTELKKMIVGTNFGYVAREFSAVLSVIIPELFVSIEDVSAIIDKTCLCDCDFVSRFALMFSKGNVNDSLLAQDCLKRLKSDKKTINSVVKLIETYNNQDDIPIKKIVNLLGFENARRYISMKTANDSFVGVKESKYYKIKEELNKIESENQCVFIEDMAISGKDLLSLGYSSDKRIGKVLYALFDMVLKDEIPNNKEVLIDIARNMNNNEKN